MTDFNLAELSRHSNAEISIKINKPEHDDDAKLRRFKDRTLFVTSIITLFLVMVFCGFITWNHIITNPTLAGIALNGVIGIALGMAGYTLRGKSNN